MIMSTTFFPLFAKCLTAGAAALQFASCSCTAPQASLAKAPVAKVSGQPQHGVASIYTDHRTASGERFQSSALTAAHRSLPLGSQVRVTHLGNNKSVVVRINDRGPYIRGRIIDLTPAAAASIGLGYGQGLANVKVERIEPTPAGG
jgi:rare lipoprotein A